jgi:peptidoglycan/xylan/chitin deacetylase (PgdA/CDA1 family)
MYHCVATPELAPLVDPRVQVDLRTFAEQMRLLAECRTPLGVPELVSAMARRRVPRHSVVVTFDDGYLDTLTVAAPILERYGIPAMLYLPTDYISRSEPQWVDRLHHAILRRTKDRLVLSGATHDLRNAEVLGRVRTVLERTLMRNSLAERDALFESVEGQLRPPKMPTRLTMTWDDVRTLQKRHPRFDVGIHTAEHTDMTSRPVNVLRDELVRAQSVLHGELGRNAWHFSFPYSRDDEASQHLVRTLGYESAVTEGDEILVHSGADPLRMLRLEPHDNVAMLRYWTSGAHPELPRIVFGRA